jgi:thiamine biosynthesis protein ThiS
MQAPGLPRPLPFATFRSSMSETIAITVNGETRQVAAGESLAALLRAIGLDTRKVAVERNEEIVPRSTYPEVTIAAGDRLEIVHFIGGG